MNKIKKYKFIYITIFIFILTLSFMNKSYSSEIEEVELVECSKSSAYLAWEKLSDEEKENTPMPNMCDKEKDNLRYYNFTYDAKGNLPTSYDGKNTKVKDQGKTGGCWAFSTTTALESYIKKQDNLTYNFSTRHIEYSSTRVFLNGAINDHGYNRSLGTGGHFYMSSNYLINGYGPIAESAMPFENNENKIAISNIQNKTTLVDVNNIVLSYNTVGKKCTAAQIQDIKENIYSNGSVATTTYITTDPKYYSSTNAAYYYNGTENINHAITLVGWNDNYSRTNFSSSTRPTTNGAWIVQNSYGTSFGKGGYYYLSYEDVHICDFYMAIDELDYEVEDNSYILDKLGYISFMGYQSKDGLTEYKTAYAMNVFTKKQKKEELKEVTFGSNGPGSYRIYLYKGKATTTTSISNMTLIGTGRMEYAGYITHKLDEEIILDKNLTNFTIAIYYQMDTATKPIPVSISSASKYEYVEATPATSFISLNGTSWTDLSTRTYATIASIKAFTNNVEDYTLKVNNYNISYNTNALLTINTTASNININEIDIYIKNKTNNTITPLNISYTNGSNLSKINITLTRPTIEDTYTVMIYYKDSYIYSFNINISGTSSLTSSTYQINNNTKMIYINPNTNVTTFLNNINGESGNIYKNATAVTSGIVSTGMTINNYIIIVKGDVTGDGYAKMNDVMMISKFIVENTGLTNNTKQAADVTSDNNIKMNDVMKISKYIVEGGSL